MKISKKLTTVVMAIVILSALSVAAFAAGSGFGSAAVEKGETYTLSDMLTYAVQDEYLAKAEYESIIDTYGAQRPFTNIIKAEETHIAAIEPLFAEYGSTLPLNTADDYTVIPASLTDAYTAGVEAEINNIAMYESFLEQELTDDVRAVFTALKDASEKHLLAFENAVSRSENSVTGVSAIRGRQVVGRGR